MSEFDSTVAYKDIEGFPGYKVGDDGSIWSCRTPGRGFGKFGTWKKLTQSASGKGYRKVTLMPGYVPRNVHVIVLTAFVGPCPPDMECCHNNGNPADNRLANLRWDTPKENSADSRRHGTIFRPRGELSGRSKLTTALVISLRADYASGQYTRKELRVKYGISKTAVQNIIVRSRWAHVA
jgi:hypothetical protein